MFNIILDTNILVAALRSKQGASFALLSLVGMQRFELSVSVPLVFEYEAVLGREELGIDQAGANAVIDYLCDVAIKNPVHFLWRPFLRDAKDDMVLEAAMSGQCSHIVTFNTKDFVGIEQFGLQALWPGDFLKLIGEHP